MANAIHCSFSENLLCSFERSDGVVVVDAMVYATMFEEAVGPNGKSTGFERWLVDPKTQTVQRTVLDSLPLEFPRVDDRFFGRQHRFVWSIGVPEEIDPQRLSTGRLFRHDLVSGMRMFYDFGPDSLLGEFSFVARSPEAEEGDGWVMGFVLNVSADRSDLIILSSDLSAVVARVHIPHRIPPGFHGNFMPDDSPLSKL